MIITRRKAISMSTNVAAALAARRAMGGLLPFGGSTASGGGGGGTPAFAPNYNSAGAGTSMTSPYTLDRQWVTGDRTAANALGGAADSYGWTWSNGDYNQSPTIDTPANVSTIVGATVTAPPDGATQGLGTGTVMALEWPAGKPIGQTPFKVNPPSGNTTQAQKFYWCGYFYIPSNFSQNGNVVKWVQLAQSQANGACNHLFLLMMTGTLNAPGTLGLQGDVNATIQNTGVNLTKGAWHCLELFAAAENPWGSTNGVAKAWLDGVSIYSQTNVQFFTAFSITSISKANPCAVVTSAPTNFASGDSICFSGVGGMTQINTSGGGIGGSIGTITDSQHFTVNINTTSFGTYTSGGLCTRDQGSFNPFGGILIPYLGGGGSPAAANEYMILGRMFTAYSNT